jgi:hypothetical protein
MKVPAIKNLIEKYTIIELEEAENAILEETQIAIDVEGDHEGERLTHVLAAIWCKKHMETNSVAANLAIREYSLKVRNTIS